MEPALLTGVALPPGSATLERVELRRNGRPPSARIALASVVIPTRDRRDDLYRCLAAVARQQTARDFEVVVVDDGSEPPLEQRDIEHCPNARLVRGLGEGPAIARNLGAANARGQALVFTDDDAEPDPTWLEAACEGLEAHPELAGIEGPVASPAVDYLRGYTVRSRAPGAFLTCNIAYRRQVFEAVGGFCELFPYAHCEDLDLGFRAARVGPVGFSSAMGVTHHPRHATLWGLARRGRLISSEYILHSRHPQLYPQLPLVPWRFQPVFNIARRWFRLVRDDRSSLLRSPHRAVRLLFLAAAQTAVALITAVRAPEARRHARASG